MKILVTGGSGFIGGPVLMSLIENFNLVEILNLTRSSLKSTTKQIENYKCDLSNAQTYINKVIEFEPEVVIHLAWEGIPDFSLEMSTKNILSSISFIEIVTKVQSCKKIIVTGSCFEYNNKFGICNELDGITPKDYFTFAKKTILSFLEFECNRKNIIYSWARLFYVYGPNQRKESLIPTLIETLKSNKSPDLRTPKNANDFIHVNDVADGIIKMISNNIESGIYNLGSGNSTPVTEISKFVELALSGKELLTNELIEKTIKSEKTVDFKADIQKSVNMLNWRTKIRLSEGINSVINNNRI
jgi:nucleoside-diphosphate-sugar epimerase